MTWLSRISVGTDYLSGVLGPMLLLGAGMGVVFVPLTMASLPGVHPEDSGAASSMVNVMQQVGGSLGLAILVTAYSNAFGNATQHPWLASPGWRRPTLPWCTAWPAPSPWRRSWTCSPWS